jgi:hypothetical protein
MILSKSEVFDLKLELLYFYKILYIIIGLVIIGIVKYLDEEWGEEKKRNEVLRISGLFLLLHAAYYIIRAIILFKMNNLNGLFSLSFKEQIIAFNLRIHLFYIIYALVTGGLLTYFTYSTEALKVILLRCFGLILTVLGIISFFTFITHILISKYDSQYFRYIFSFYEIIYLVLGLILYRYSFNYIFIKKEDKEKVYTKSNRLIGLFLLLFGLLILHDTWVVLHVYNQINNLPIEIVELNKLTYLYDIIRFTYLILIGASILLINFIFQKDSLNKQYIIKYLLIISVIFCIGIGILSLQKTQYGTLKAHIKDQIREVFKPKPQYYEVGWKAKTDVSIDALIETTDQGLVYIGSGAIIKQGGDGKEIWRVSLKAKGLDIRELNGHYYVLVYNEDYSRSIVKFDTNGKWKSSVSLPVEYNYVTNITTMGDSLLVSGVNSEVEDDNLLLITMDQEGQILSEQKETLSMKEHVNLNSAFETSEQHIVVEGSSRGKGFMVLINKNGGIVWESILDFGQMYHYIENREGKLLAILKDGTTNLTIREFDQLGDFTDRTLNTKENSFGNMSTIHLLDDGEFIATGQVGFSRPNQLVISRFSEEKVIYHYVFEDKNQVDPRLITQDGSIILTSSNYYEFDYQIIKLTETDQPLTLKDYIPLVLVSITGLLIIGIPLIHFKRR